MTASPSRHLFLLLPAPPASSRSSPQRPSWTVRPPGSPLEMSASLLRRGLPCHQGTIVLQCIGAGGHTSDLDVGHEGHNMHLTSATAEGATALGANMGQSALSPEHHVPHTLSG